LETAAGGDTEDTESGAGGGIPKRQASRLQ